MSSAAETCFLAKILCLEFVFLPVREGWTGWGAGGHSSLHSRWVGATHTHESGLSHVYSSHWELKVVLLTAEDAF